MMRAIFSKVMWVGKATTFLVGLAVIVGLTAGLVSQATAANGQSLILGRLNNVATALTRLSGNVAGPALQIINLNSAANATALNLATRADRPPMRVNSATKVANLNADKVDGNSLACPTGTRLHEGVCIETALRSTSATLSAAQTDCLDETGTRLPTPAELQTLEGRTHREWSNHLYYDATGTSYNPTELAVETSRTISTVTQGGDAAYRCVKQPS